MPTINYTAWACKIQPDTAPAPALTDDGVFFVPRNPPSQTMEEAENAFRLDPPEPEETFLLSQISDLQLVTTSGGGGSGGSGGTEPTAVVPIMESIRTRYRQGVSLVDVGFTGAGEWRYKVARSPVVNNRQQTPVWDAIAWADAPLGTGERVLTLPDYVQKVVHVLFQSKTRPSENYEVRINCLPGNTQGHDWILYAMPSAGLLDTANFQVLEMGRTWREDLAITRENGPTAGEINIRIKSGFARENGTRWFWWLGGVPLFDKADQDNFTVTVKKGELVELHRYIAKTAPFVRYDQKDTSVNPAGEVIVSQQWTATYYVDDNLLDVDAATIWTGLN